MDWDLAIERHRVPLLGHVMGLCAMIGLTEGGTIERVPKPLHRYVLRILRTAESAVRRLIVAAARDIVVEYEPPRERPAPAKPKASGKVKDKAEGEAKPKRKRRPLFNLFDALKRFGRRRVKKMRRPEPRAYYIDIEADPRNPISLVVLRPEHPPAAAPVVEEKRDDGTVDAKHLIRRLVAVVDALQDIPAQAMRLARWQGRPKEERRPERWSPLRPGRPPGYRQRPKHEVDEILKECHWLASNGMPQLDDTS